MSDILHKTEVKEPVVCDECKGKGEVQPIGFPERCRKCEGTGKIETGYTVKTTDQRYEKRTG